MADKTTGATEAGTEVFRTPAGSLMCAVNDMEQAQDGGRVMLTLDNDSPGGKILYNDARMNGVSAVLNFLLDRGMEVFPTDKAGMLAKRYTLVIYEEPAT